MRKGSESKEKKEEKIKLKTRERKQMLKNYMTKVASEVIKYRETTG